METFALQSTKWLLDVATRLVKATVRLHNAEVITDDMAVIFTANHFTRVETLLLPYILHRELGRTVWSLAAADLFVGRIGAYLRSTGTLSTRDPDRDTIIVNSLLEGRHPWIIFPEGAMIKDKRVVDRRGMFNVCNRGVRRMPHKGAAVLALRTEYFRRRLRCARDNPDSGDVMADLLARFGLTSEEHALSKRTVIVPANITYFPIRVGENLFLKVAKALAADLTPRAVEELSVEGTMLSRETDIDVTLGDPIDVAEYLDSPEYEHLMACRPTEFTALEEDPHSAFSEAARRLMMRYMREIYGLTTVNLDHLLAGLVHARHAYRMTERTLRHRLFLCLEELRRSGTFRIHPDLEKPACEILCDEVRGAFGDLLELFVKEGTLRREGAWLCRSVCRLPSLLFESAREHDLTKVIANEIEPLAPLSGAVHHVAALPDGEAARRVRNVLTRGELDRFNQDYSLFHLAGESKPKEVGRPFLLEPRRLKAGVVLIHGYMAAPLEVRLMAEYLSNHGYGVYGVRLEGHGTAPEDLARTTWEQWYESVRRAYAIMKTITEHVVLGGFSTGGTLALLGGARMGNRLRGVFSINAPLQLVNYAAKLASSIVTMNVLLSRINMQWEYVDNQPDNPHINYLRNPIRGVSELSELMRVAEASLGQVHAPTLVVQGSHDPTVDPVSGTTIFEGLGAEQKELSTLNRATHGIINGEGSEQVFARVVHFLERVRAGSGGKDLREAAG